jgi:hypothetical protein
MARRSFGRPRRHGACGSKSPRPFSLLEPLESRILCAGHGPKPTFDLADLSGYTLGGTSLDYDINYSLLSNLVSPASGSGGENVTVNQVSGSEYAVDAASDSGSDLNVNLETGSKGLNLTEIDFSPSDDGTLTPFTVSNVPLLPSSIKQGATKKGSGKFSGDVDIEDTILPNIIGTAKGKCKTSTKAIGVEAVTVPAGTFSSAVEADSNIKLSGKIKMASGQTASFTATLDTTFWATDGVGIVQAEQTLIVTIKVPHEAPGILNLQTGAELTATAG